MIRGKTVAADFQFIGHRINMFKLETKLISAKNKKVNMEYDFDYNIKDQVGNDEELFGVIELIINVKAKVAKAILYKINLKIEGAFTGVAHALSHEKFTEMIEINGVVTLTQTARAFLLSTTCQTGINPPVRLPMVN